MDKENAPSPVAASARRLTQREKLAIWKQQKAAKKASKAMNSRGKIKNVALRKRIEKRKLGSAAVKSIRVAKMQRTALSPRSTNQSTAKTRSTVILKPVVQKTANPSKQPQKSSTSCFQKPASRPPATGVSNSSRSRNSLSSKPGGFTKPTTKVADSPDDEKAVSSKSIESFRERLQRSAKKQRRIVRSGVSATSISLKERLSAKKIKKRAKLNAAEVIAQAKRRVTTEKKKKTKTKKGGISIIRESDSVRAARAIEESIPERRRKERESRLLIIAMGDVEVAEEHLKFGRHSKAREVLDKMSPETRSVAHTCAKYWAQRVHIEDRCANYQKVLHVVKQALASTGGKELAAVQQELTRFADKARSMLKAFEATASPTASIASAADEEETTRRLSFTGVTISPPQIRDHLSFSGANAAEDTNADTSMDMVFDDSAEALDLDIGNEDDTESQVVGEPDLRYSVAMRHLNGKNSGKKLLKPDCSEGSPPASSVIRMATIRLTGDAAQNMQSEKALTPVRRAARLLSGEPQAPTSELLKEADFNYVPNLALVGAHFAPDMEEVESGSEASVGSPGDDEANPKSAEQDSEGLDPVREPTPMPVKASRSMMPPPPLPTAAASQFGSIRFVDSNGTPLRRSSRVTSQTPTPIRKEMEKMLGF